MNKFFAIIALSFAVLATTPYFPNGDASAAVIAAWDYDGYRYDPNNPANCVAPTDTLSPHLSNTNLAMHSWGVQSNSDGEFRAYNWSAGTNTLDTSYPYASFTVSVDSGYVLSLSSFQYAPAWSTDSSAPGLGIWGYRINGGAWIMQAAPCDILRSAPSTLSTWSFTQPLTVSQNVEFAFWAYGVYSPNGGISYGNDLRVLTNFSGNELILNGTVAQATPEPVSIALIVLGVAVLIWRHRLNQPDRTL